MALKLYLLRNGETLSSQRQTYYSQLDVELTPTGQQMAQCFAQAYGHLSWQAIWVSPAKRAIQMAQPLCAQTGMTPQIRPALQELNYGRWEGLTPEQVSQRFHDQYVRWLADPGWNRPTGGERGVDVARRLYGLIEEIEDAYADGNILLISHKSLIRILLCVLLGIDPGRYRDRFAMFSGSLTLLEFGPHGPFIHRLGDRSYLSESFESSRIT